MINVCAQCGEYHAEKTIDPEGPAAICPACGHRHPFLQRPLLFVTGASGTGKSTICRLLAGKITQAVLLDVDILWGPHFENPDEGYRIFFETWLRMAKNIAQSGHPAVLFGAGTGVPHNMEPRVERRYIGPTHYLALVCDDNELENRLRSRPAWRKSGTDSYLKEPLSFNHWFKERGPLESPPITLLDTTNSTEEQTKIQVKTWIETNLSNIQKN